MFAGPGGLRCRRGAEPHHGDFPEHGHLHRVQGDTLGPGGGGHDPLVVQMAGLGAFKGSQTYKTVMGEKEEVEEKTEEDREQQEEEEEEEVEDI